MADSHDERLRRARIALEGLSVGDGFGGFFEGGRPESLPYHLKTHKLPPRPWNFTDDTNMALSIYSVLRVYQTIDQDKLGLDFGKHFDRTRGYGLGTRGVLMRMQKGATWREAAYARGNGGGSYGNGGAMRVAPLGAYFADDMEALVENARLSSEVTHAHPEGIAGAIAVAAATAVAWQARGKEINRQVFIDQILPYVPDSAVKTGIETARELPDGIPVWPDVVGKIGNGSGISAQDTVPYVLWCAGERLANYEESIWLTASGGGDVDTTCAMVGGIVAMYTGAEGIPADWIQAREPLPDWALTGS
ncbi:MAG: ADP-ribosylglycohydrolase family protein [Chloroflexota bacterium]